MIKRFQAMALASLGLSLACSGDNGQAPEDQIPTITITGVTDGLITTQPVTIGISVDVGTFVAELNGETFFSGRTVSDPGEYSLSVTARNGEAVATEDLAFVIMLSGETRLIVRMLDLGDNEAGGGGDALLLTDSSAAGMKHVLIDAGPAGTNASDPAFVARRLVALDVDTLEALILTHAHSDHYAGMTQVLDQVHVRRFFYNNQDRNTFGYNQVISRAQTRAGEVSVPTAIVEFTAGFGSAATNYAVIPPLTTFLTKTDADGSEINEGSLGTEVVKGGFRMFVTGDGEVLANLRWRTQFPARSGDLDVLKAGHHGANDALFDNGFSGSSAWLNHTDPEVAVVSANGTSHPRINATTHLLAQPALMTYCTNVHGDIEIRVGDEGDYFVTVERNEAQECTPGVDATTGPTP